MPNGFMNPDSGPDAGSIWLHRQLEWPNLTFFKVESYSFYGSEYGSLELEFHTFSSFNQGRAEVHAAPVPQILRDLTVIKMKELVSAGQLTYLGNVWELTSVA